jgi:hypothetical protein
MTRSIVICGAVGAAAFLGASITFAQNQPGLPTLAQVHILNRDRGDAVPVKVQNTGDSLPVVLVGEPTVALATNAIVGTRSARQVWEYRRIAVPVASDATPALTAAGLEGWEAVAAVTSGTNAVWTLKRPR